MKMQITHIHHKDGIYHTAEWKNGNLHAFSMFQLVCQLILIYGFPRTLLNYLNN